MQLVGHLYINTQCCFTAGLLIVERKTMLLHKALRTVLNKIKNFTVYDQIIVAYIKLSRLSIMYCTAQQPLVTTGLLIIDASRSHLDTKQSVGLLWASDQPDAENSDNTQQSRHTDIHAPGGIRTCNPRKRAAATRIGMHHLQMTKKNRHYRGRFCVFNVAVPITDISKNTVF